MENCSFGGVVVTNYSRSLRCYMSFGEIDGSVGLGNVDSVAGEVVAVYSYYDTEAVGRYCMVEGLNLSMGV